MAIRILYIDEDTKEELASFLVLDASVKALSYDMASGDSKAPSFFDWHWNVLADKERKMVDLIVDKALGDGNEYVTSLTNEEKDLVVLDLASKNVVLPTVKTMPRITKLNIVKAVEMISLKDRKEE